MGAGRRVGAGLPAKGPGLLANFTRRSPLLLPPYSRVNPLLQLIEGGHRSVVGHRPPCRSGFTRERAGPAGQFHPPFTGAAATVFAGKPAPTPDRGWTHIGDWAQSRPL
ncbi:hypothetical protein PRJ_3537 [Pseudomonas sp. XWY-1]|nr:hypothetical protein PRJ_3537 [Pseudomonas sp. XWY-1]